MAGYDPVLLEIMNSLLVGGGRRDGRGAGAHRLLA